MIKIALAQINTTVGDFNYNYEKIKTYIEFAKKENADLVIFPELTITGYPPKDLLMKKSFVKKNEEIAKKLINETTDIAVILGYVDEIKSNLYNTIAFFKNGQIIGKYHKIHLPNYDVFDEKRYFKEGDKTEIFEFKNTKIGLTVCEDIWIKNGPVTMLKEKGAELIINISASPYHLEKESIRRNMVASQAKDNQVPLVYCNLVGGQDDLIFDGKSYVFNNKGELVKQMASFKEEIGFVTEINAMNPIAPKPDFLGDIYHALVLGVKDYFRKNGFNKAYIGLSGGIDSALTAAIAVEALGKDNVVGICMPSKFSSEGSITDSYDLANNLRILCETIPINGIYESYLSALNKQFNDTEFNVAEENLQARARGNILMALSNKFGYLVLATGNKSEFSVGYSTLYGDMAGGLSVISDLFKTTVYKLCEYINRVKDKIIIPENILTKAPSAELREDQKDSDSLPEYDVLDPILLAYVEHDKSLPEIVEMGFDPKVVKQIILMVDRNEYKRQQAALGLRISPRAFGQGRRMPITNRWRGE